MATLVDERYMRLIERFPLVPITDDEQVQQAIEVVEPLALKGTMPGALTPGEAAYLEVLSRLIQDYEENRYPLLGESDSAA